MTCSDCATPIVKSADPYYSCCEPCSEKMKRDAVVLFVGVIVVVFLVCVWLLH